MAAHLALAQARARQKVLAGSELGASRIRFLPPVVASVYGTMSRHYANIDPATQWLHELELQEVVGSQVPVDDFDGFFAPSGLPAPGSAPTEAVPSMLPLQLPRGRSLMTSYVASRAQSPELYHCNLSSQLLAHMVVDALDWMLPFAAGHMLMIPFPYLHLTAACMSSLAWPGQTSREEADRSVRGFCPTYVLLASIRLLHIFSKREPMQGQAR